MGHSINEIRRALQFAVKLRAQFTGENLRRWRHRAIYSQTDLARMAGVSIRHVMDLEHERKMPSLNMMLKLAATLESGVVKADEAMNYARTPE